MIDPISKKLLVGAGQHGHISLMYHSISPGKIKPDWKWALSFNNFRDQLALLQDQGWTTHCANQLLVSNYSFPEKSVFITFDDGYANNFTAFEELTKRNMVASWFIVTKDVGYMSSWSDQYSPSYKLLSTAQLLEMQNAGMEIGSHTYSHQRLTLVRELEVEHELSESKDFLSDLLKKPVTSFAYPYGLYNQAIVSAVRSVGYKTAFTTRTGFGLVNNDPLEVRRVSIMADDSLSTFARKLAFADSDVNWNKVTHYGLSRIRDRLSRK